MADHLPILVWIANADGHAEYFNSFWYEYTGQKPQSAKGWGWKEALHPSDIPKILSEWPSPASPAQIFKAEHRLKSVKTGQYRWFLTQALPVRNENGKLVQWFGTSMDIHETKIGRQLLEETQAQLVESKIAAEMANSAKSEFIANMSHEIRTPLTAIAGYSEFLLESGRISEPEMNFVNSIARNSKHLANIVDEILDPTRLRQILLNVIGNAVKFTNKGQVEVEVSCPECEETTSYSAHRKLQIKVRDSGIGISDVYKDQLFTRFRQSDSSTTRIFGGTGLGLALSKKLAIALGGDIQLVESALGKGATFLITIGIGEASDFSNFELRDRITERMNHQLASEKKPFKDLSILVVDDSPDNIDLVKLMLKPMGARITTATNGFDGVKNALMSDFDLVLMDIQMPGLDGNEAAMKLRHEGFRKPIIAFTAGAMKEDREASFRAGFDDHLTKPIDRDVLLNTVSHYAGKINKTSFEKNAAQK